MKRYHISLTVPQVTTLAKLLTQHNIGNTEIVAFVSHHDDDGTLLYVNVEFMVGDGLDWLRWRIMRNGEYTEIQVTTT